MTAKVKIIADVTPEVKEALKELAHQNRTSMTDMLVKLIENASK